jgi:hypothetical protein
MGHSTDGWYSLTSILARTLKVNTLRIRASSPVGPRYVCDFTFWTKGTERRTVMALNDEPWVFYQRGPLLPEEDESMYKARRISDRLNPSYLAVLAQRLGWPVAESAFWSTKGQAVVLHSYSLAPSAPSSAA